MVVSGDGSTAYVTEPAHDLLLVLNTRTNAVLAQVPTGPTPSGLALSPDGRQVWVVDTNVPGIPAGDGAVTVVSTLTYQALGTITVGPGAIDVAFSPDGTRAYVTDNGPLATGAVTVIDVASLTPVAFLDPRNTNTDWNPTSVAVSASGDEVWVSETSALGSTGQNDFVYVFDAHSAQPFGAAHILAKIRVGKGPFFMVLPKGSPYAYVADKESCDVKQIDTSTFQVVSTIEVRRISGCPFGLAASSNSSVVYVATGNDKTVNLGRGGRVVDRVDFETGTVAPTGFLGTDPVTLTLDPTGALLYVVDAEAQTIESLSTQNGAVEGGLRLPQPPSTSTTP
jgi:YVTN family beta-propeller protein